MTIQIGYKTSFTQAVSDYKYALNKIKRLEEQLQIYEMKSISPSSITFGIEGATTRDPYKCKFVEWLIKIDEVKAEIKDLKSKISPLLAFRSHLTLREQEILDSCFINNLSETYVASLYNVSKSRISYQKYNIKRKWEMNNAETI